MPEMDYSEHLRPIVRTLQKIAGAMVVGSAAFLIVCMFSGLTPDASSPMTLSYTALGIAPLSVIGSFILAHVIVSNGRSQIIQREYVDSRIKPHDVFASTDAGRVCGVLSTVTIIRCAMIEGAALLACLAYMNEGNQLVLAATVVLIAVLAAHIPTTVRTKHWIAHQLRIIERSRPQDQ